jgi:anti-anti-sigma factor
VTTIIERTGPRSFRLFGSVDASNAGGVADLVDEFLAEPGDLTIEMRDLEFLDSVGMGVLATAASRLGGRGVLILESPTHAVARAVELAGLLTVSNVQIREETQPLEGTLPIEEPPS